MEFKHLTGSTADTFLEYIERNLPEGVALKVYKTAIEPLPQHLIAPKINKTSDQNNT
jgi:small subunit ribosomal protein S10